MDARQWSFRTLASTASLFLAVGGANGQSPPYRVVNPSCCPPCQTPAAQPTVIYPLPQTPTTVPSPPAAEAPKPGVQPPSAQQLVTPDAMSSTDSPDLGLGGGLALGESTVALSISTMGDQFGRGAVRGSIIQPTITLPPGAPPIYVSPGAPTTPGVVSVPIETHIPNPSDGGAVGRLKIADDNNPLPRDRFILNYDYFDDVGVTPQGVSVNRYVVGVEKTFFCGRASIEARVPLADTLDSALNVDSDSSSRELGNVLLTFKYLVFQDSDLAGSVGIGVTLPTADGADVRLDDGSEFISIPNRSYSVTPFAALLYTPNDRLFVQTWAAVNFDANGTPVHVNPTLTGFGESRIGRIRDGEMLQLDGQIGYWLIREECGCLRGLAPFLEVHWNKELADGNVATVGNLTVGDLSDSLDELNISVGFLSQFGRNLVVTTGAVFPVRGGDDRMFDYQVGLRANWLFGRSARNRATNFSTSTF